PPLKISWSLVPRCARAVETDRPLSADDEARLAEAAEAEPGAALRVAGARAADLRAAGARHAAAAGGAGAGGARRPLRAGATDRRTRRLADVRRRIADAAAALSVGRTRGPFAPAGLAAEHAALRVRALVAHVRAAAAPRTRRAGLAGRTAVAVREIDLA